MIDVEAALARSLAKVGLIPKKDAEEISSLSLERVKLDRILELEREIQHETMALVLAMAEALGESGRFVHFGATSNDITDTATALQIRDALNIVERDLKGILRTLLELAREHKDTVMVGRTHGQHAVPITLGLKFSVWACEIGRHLERLRELRPRILVGKMSGAVGTGAAWGDKALEVQEEVMRELGLGAPLASTQILQRDRFAELIFFLSLVASTFDKVGREIRNLQRPEVGELAEPFLKSQVGSSTMPHKQNPIRCEKICGLARVLRSQVSSALENVVLEHERDLTNSSCERVLLPQTFLLLDEILKTASFVLQNLRVFPEEISKNLKLTGGLNMAEAVMIELTLRGMSRQEAHALLRKCSSRAVAEKISFIDTLKSEAEVVRYIDPKELERLLNPREYLGATSSIIERVLEKLSSLAG